MRKLLVRLAALVGVVIGLAALAGLGWVAKLIWENRLPDAKTFAEIGKNAAEALAWLCGGLFFVYKAITGYLVTNMAIKVDCARRSVPDSRSQDYLHITATLTKGDKGTVRVHDVQARIKTPARDSQHIPFHGFLRRTYLSEIPPLDDNDEVSSEEQKANEAGGSGMPMRAKICWTRRSQKSPFMNLSTGEATQLSCYTTVPRGLPCEVYVTVLGENLGTGEFSQWRASCVSLPAPAGDRGAGSWCFWRRSV